MATYRGAVPTDLPEKTISTSQGGADPGPSDTSPAVPADVIYKLLGFTLAMVVLPIGGYFLTVKTVFRGEFLHLDPLLDGVIICIVLVPAQHNADIDTLGSAVYAGAFAALMANVVLIGYVLVAMKEDQSDQLAAEKAKKGKKAQ